MYGYDRKWSEWLDPTGDFGDTISDLVPIVEHNKLYRKILHEKDMGRPGHYYGRDIVIEGAMPINLFLLAAQEFGGDENWWRDDKKFDSYMKRNPLWDWRNG